jgi:hypothetical protein
LKFVSAVDDVRKLLQDFLAPELRAISVRLDAVEARLTQQDVQRQHDKEALESRLTQQDTQRQRDKKISCARFKRCPTIILFQSGWPKLNRRSRRLTNKSQLKRDCPIFANPERMS